MLKIKTLIWALIFMSLSCNIFANTIKPIACKHLRDSEIKNLIKKIDKKFQWDSTNCKIVGTRSIFPRKAKTGVIDFEKGLQLFIYQNNQLKFICLPGWECKSW